MKNIILGFLLLAQITVWFVIDPPWGQRKARTDIVDQKKLEAVATDQVGRIRIQPPGLESLTLEKSKDRWTIREAQGFPATESTVAALLLEMDLLAKSGFRSPKSAMHDTYEVSAAKGTRLTLETADAKLIGKYIIGKRDIQGLQGTFIRLDGDDDVYVTPAKKLASLLTVDPKRWYDPAMMDVDYRQQARLSELSSNCYRLEIESNAPDPKNPELKVRKRFVYEKVAATEPGGEAQWRVVEPSDQKELKLNGLLVKGLASAVLSTRAVNLIGATTQPEYGLDDPDEIRLRVRARFKDDNEETVRTLEIGNEIPPIQAGRPSRFRYAKSSYPGDQLKQRFVFAISNVTPRYYERGPAVLEQKADPKKKKAASAPK
ncbi:MAG: DUF4340 domain-containing protein [Planctomycetota bacterium]